MRRVLLLFFLFAWESFSDSSTPAGLVWLENPSCGGILIEADVVLSLKACLGSKTQIVWPYRSEISYSVRHSDSNLAILFLSRALPHPVEPIRMSELSHLKQMMPIHFSNLEQSVVNWIDTLENTTFTVFYGVSPPLMGSPVWTKLDPGGLRVVGMITGEKKAIRLDPYLNFIATEVKLAHEGRQKAQPPKPIIILPAQVVSAQIPATVVVAEPDKTEPSQTRPDSAPAVAKLPVSLGCSCSQVRR